LTLLERKGLPRDGSLAWIGLLSGVLLHLSRILRHLPRVLRLLPGVLRLLPRVLRLLPGVLRGHLPRKLGLL
jgi:hypothetical protein